MSSKRKTAGAAPFWVSSALLAIVAVAAISFGLRGGQSVTDTRAGPIASAQPIASFGPDPAPVPMAKPEPDQLAPSQDTHQARFRAEQQAETARLLAKHPPLRFAEIAASAERVEVIAVGSGDTPAQVQPAEPETAGDYEAYKATALGRRELIALHITRTEPFFLVLLSDGPVTYDVQTQVSGALRGVLISSNTPSTIEGLPTEVPLQIVTGEAAVEPFARRPRAGDDRAALESDLREVFPEHEIDIKKHDDSPVILVR